MIETIEMIICLVIGFVLGWCTCVERYSKQEYWEVKEVMQFAKFNGLTATSSLAITGKSANES